LLLLIRSIPALLIQVGSLIKMNRTNHEDWVRSFLSPSVLIIIVKLHKWRKILYASAIGSLMYVHVCTRPMLLMNVIGRYLNIPRGFIIADPLTKGLTVKVFVEHVTHMGVMRSFELLV